MTSIDEMFDYDDDNRLVELTDDNFESTSYTYDVLSRWTPTTYADSQYVEYSWNANDGLAGWTDQNGTVVANAHDALDRLTARSVSPGDRRPDDGAVLQLRCARSHAHGGRRRLPGRV